MKISSRYLKSRYYHLLVFTFYRSNLNTNNVTDGPRYGYMITQSHITIK